MKTIRALQSFEAYPHGNDKRRERFVEGGEYQVADAAADLYVEKGHARLVGEAKTEEPADKRPTKKTKE